MILLDSESERPLYSQLTSGVMEAIIRGDLSTGDTLPSVRSLASDLGVNMHTVNKSYHELEAKGIIEIISKKGAVITASLNGEISMDRRAWIQQEFRPAIAEALVRGMSDSDVQLLVKQVIQSIKEG
ncbi:GntR family transcriptional regulator [Bacillus coahuilensis p1.1.43]|uniref:GntR family transcriptional regulator n=1 Tax=Bacillus coahuilensis p1.1.43 TaxID=1150625 RepID=A0A147KBM8_9BACI|nr:GntR family transcriptional regulator [Bacillus coahuilensis]KUP08744.1 GntR family transcriptional regulator [Bacillus coahuilensis p1.1.43]